MPITAISAVWYPVVDWERAKAFYSEALGLHLEAGDDRAGWAIYRASADSPPFFLVRKIDREGSGGGGVVTFAATDAAALRSGIEQAGGRWDDTVQEGDGVRIFTVYDPDGNRLELSESVDAR